MILGGVRDDGVVNGGGQGGWPPPCRASLTATCCIIQQIGGVVSEWCVEWMSRRERCYTPGGYAKVVVPRRIAEVLPRVACMLSG